MSFIPKKIDSEVFNPNCKSEKMSKNDMDKLMEYYRMRLANCEKERREWMAKIEGAKTQSEEFHQREWDLRKLTEKITELQQSLSESNIALNQERKKVIHYNNEIDTFKLGTKEDRRRMIQLLQFCEPIENTMKMFYDRRPEISDKMSNVDYDYDARNQFISNSVSLKKNIVIKKPGDIKKSKSKSKGKHPSNQSMRITPSDARRNVVKTIMFPTTSKESFASDENETLKKQKEEIEAMYDNIITKMEEDGRLREEEFRLQSINMANKTAELKKRKQRLEKDNYDVTQRFMDLKYDLEINNKKLNEEFELAKLQNEALQNSLKDVIKKCHIEREVSKNEYARKTKDVTNSLRNQVRAKEEKAILVKEQYKQIQKIYADKVNALEAKLSMIINKCRELESREGIQVENYKAEMARLREKLRQFEGYTNELKKMTYGFNDNYEAIRNRTMEMNQEFFIDTQRTDESLNMLKNQLVAELREYSRVVKGNVEPEHLANSHRSEEEGERNQYQSNSNYNQQQYGEEEGENDQGEGEQGENEQGENEQGDPEHYQEGEEHYEEGQGEENYQDTEEMKNNYGEEEQYQPNEEGYEENDQGDNAEHGEEEYDQDAEN